jgi:hypothetical protein
MDHLQWCETGIAHRRHSVSLSNGVSFLRRQTQHFHSQDQGMIHNKKNCEF